MRLHTVLRCLVLCVGALGAPAGLFAQGAPADTPPADSWPRGVDLGDAQVLVYQPQVNSWTDNQLSFRAALAIKPSGAKAETFGVIFATTRTQVDKVLRTVTFENLKISKIDFPTLPNRGAAYATELQTQFAASIRTISLDRLESSLALAGIRPPTVVVQNNPPWIIVSYAPAILVPIDGAPVLKAVPNSPFQRVINTRALILLGAQSFYIHVYDGWLQSSAITGPWTQSFNPPPGIDGVAQSLAGAGAVDLLDGGAKANPKPSLANGVPTIFTSQVPAELIVFKGQPNFQPVVGTQLLWASNTTSDVLIDITNNDYYVLISGRWFDSAALTGPWTFVPSNALPPDFAHIPPLAPAGAVLRLFFCPLASSFFVYFVYFVVCLLDPHSPNLAKTASIAKLIGWLILVPGSVLNLLLKRSNESRVNGWAFRRGHCQHCVDRRIAGCLSPRPVAQAERVTIGGDSYETL